MTKNLAAYCHPQHPSIWILDKQSGRKLASYGPSRGFEATPQEHRDESHVSKSKSTPLLRPHEGERAARSEQTCAASGQQSLEPRPPQQSSSISQ